MIKIDIPMPITCQDCIFNTSMLGFDWCCIKIEYSWTGTNNKPDWCPLKEITQSTTKVIRGKWGLDDKCSCGKILNGDEKYCPQCGCKLDWGQKYE